MPDEKNQADPPPAPPQFAGSAAPTPPGPRFVGYGPPPTADQGPGPAYPSADARPPQPAGESDRGFLRRWRRRLGRNAH
jgi:hypothetical protein